MLIPLLPPSRPSFKLVIVLLARNISLNPSPIRTIIATTNVRSIKPKTAPFSKYVKLKNLVIVVVTETWLGLAYDQIKNI